MKIYLVGGAVRDHLLAQPVKERDWVVVGATINDMLKLGYKQVGKEFPVFLHPKTGEEYALARMERKVKPGYQGFTFDTSSHVTLEEDLKRRDLTINAMAETPDGKLIDPYHGKDDLKNKLLRHVSDAFAEDPVRILRVGRFLARYAHLGFKVAPETLLLMKQMVASGEVNALVAERVWKELERALTEKNPEKFFDVLYECDALSILFPHLRIEGPGIKALIAASNITDDPIIRFAVLFYAQPEETNNTSTTKHCLSELYHRYRIPNDYRELSILTALHVTKTFKAKTLSADDLLQLFNALDIYRRERRFNHFLIACQAIALSRHEPFDPAWLMTGAMHVKNVNVQELISQGFKDRELAEQLNKKRRKNIVQWLQSR